MSMATRRRNSTHPVTSSMESYSISSESTVSDPVEETIEVVIEPDPEPQPEEPVFTVEIPAEVAPPVKSDPVPPKPWVAPPKKTEFIRHPRNTPRFSR